MPDNERPNILLIQTDQHNKHVTGCYGNETVRTPNIDQLAADGMRFSDAYCPAPICVPSRMSFMTSLTPSNNRVWDNPHMLHSGIPTWAHVLGAAGYETSLVGRMHFHGPDQRHGFENRPVGELGFTAKYPGRVGEVFPNELKNTPMQMRESVEKAGHGSTRYQWYDEVVTDAAVDYLLEQAQGTNNRPFAAVVSYLLPHCPFVAPQDLFEYYYDRVDIPQPDSDQPASIRRFRESRDILEPPIPEERIRVARAAYFGLCEYIDQLIGQVLDALHANGLAENTLVVYCSDHGEMAGEHGCWWKSNYYEGSVGVPLVARMPGRIESGTVSDTVVNLMDIGPTFAEVAGTSFETRVDGHSLWPTMQGSHLTGWTQETYSEFLDRYGDVGPTRMIRAGDWKLWDYPTEPDVPPAMFNLAEDPEERTDLGQDPDHVEKRDELLEKLYEGWEPEEIVTDARRQKEWNRQLSEWGRTVQPDHPDTLDLTPPEDDFELL